MNYEIMSKIDEINYLLIAKAEISSNLQLIRLSSSSFVFVFVSFLIMCHHSFNGSANIIY